MEGKEGEPRFKKGFWKPEEDLILKKYVETHGEGNWTIVSKKSGLMRGAKSCRLRWKNYLRPNIKRGMMSEDEKDLIIRLHKLLGNRWSLIAGRLPGRTDNEVKNYWNTHLNKKPTTAQAPHLDSATEQKPQLSVQEENLETTMAATTNEGEIHRSVADSWLENLTINADYGMNMPPPPPPPDYSPFFHNNYETFMPILDNLVLSSGSFGCSSVDESIMQEMIFL